MQIHGKQYVEVKDRIKEFNEKYPLGWINTDIISQTDNTITMKATVCPNKENDGRQFFTGHAQEWKDDPKSTVNKTSFVENCETSAVGRALAMMGIGVVDSVASADEVKIAVGKEKRAMAPIPVAKFDTGTVCRKCGSSNLTTKTAGATAKRPGEEYVSCLDCNSFVTYKSDLPEQPPLSVLEETAPADDEIDLSDVPF